MCLQNFWKADIHCGLRWVWYPGVWRQQAGKKTYYSLLITTLGTVKVELQLLQLDLQLHLQQLVTLDKPCAPVTPSDNAELD